MVAGGGFEPPKLSRQIYSLIPLAARESRLLCHNYVSILLSTADFQRATHLFVSLRLKNGRIFSL